MIKVDIYEMDSWSGCRLLKTLEYSIRKEAEDKVKEVNSKNNLPYVPEYYIYAEIDE